MLSLKRRRQHERSKKVSPWACTKFLPDVANTAKADLFGGDVVILANSDSDDSAATSVENDS